VAHLEVHYRVRFSVFAAKGLGNDICYYDKFIVRCTYFLSQSAPDLPRTGWGGARAN